MVKEYKNGNDFILENKEFLDKNKYMSSFFYLDAKFLNDIDINNYAIKVESNEYKLLAIRLEPYNLLLYGDKECLDELINYLASKNFKHNAILCPSDIGSRLVNNHSYINEIGMDFMETTKYTEESSDDVIIPNISDLDELYECVITFFVDCGLPDRPTKDKLASELNNFRIIKEDNKIVSIAAFTPNTEDSYRISHVYTKPSYRGKKYARKVVNNIKNEILELGKKATLNVDKKNPISNHLYESLGFKKIYSQGIYVK